MAEEIKLYSNDFWGVTNALLNKETMGVLAQVAGWIQKNLRADQYEAFLEFWNGLVLKMDSKAAPPPAGAAE